MLPLSKHLLIDALAHITIPLSEGLSHLPLVLDLPPPAEEDIPPPLLMAEAYKALKEHCRLSLLSK